MRSTWRTSPLWMDSPDRAADLYMRTLQSDPTDLAVVEWLLEHYGSSAPADARYFRQPDAAERTLALLRARCEPRRAGRASGGNGLLLSDRRAGRRGRSMP